MEFSKLTYSEFSHLLAACCHWDEFGIDELKRKYPLSAPYIDKLTKADRENVLANTDHLIAQLQ